MRNKNFLYLSKDQVLTIHSNRIKEYGGDPGVRDKDLIDSILANVQQTFDGKLLLNTVEEIAGAYLYYFVCDHPFIDGNKRVGAFAALMFLAVNEYPEEKLLSIQDDDLVKLTLDVARGEIVREECIDRLKKLLDPCTTLYIFKQEELDNNKSGDFE
ncbi:MAG: Fic family protein [Spirochaetota bacterium]|nr:Fic family protein [Spirochaetota bacterium]